MRAAEQKEFIRKQDVVVAVNQGNTNYDMWLSDHYPSWERAYFPDTPTGLEAVAAGGADCDNLKTVNDQFGHDKGDVYLKAASRMICRVFQHSPVFRIGGDEFAVILQNGDYEDREELIRSFEERRKAQCTEAGNRWEEVHVSMGVAVYDPLIDHSVIDTVRRAGKIMYADKREKKRKA